MLKKLSVTGPLESNNEVLNKRASLKNNCVNSIRKHITSKVFFPNSLILFPFPTTPVEKCFSPKSPLPSPLISGSGEKTETEAATESKKIRGAKFEFGSNFLRRFSLTQLTS